MPTESYGMYFRLSITSKAYNIDKKKKKNRSCVCQTRGIMMLFFVWVICHALVSSLVEAVQPAASSSFGLERKGGDSQAQLPGQICP